MLDALSDNIIRRCFFILRLLTLYIRRDLDEYVTLPNSVQRATPKPQRMQHKGASGSVRLHPIVPPATIMKRAKASQEQSMKRLKAVEVWPSGRGLG